MKRQRDWKNAVAANSEEVLRWPDLHAMVKLSRNTVRKLEKEGRFPKRVQLTDYSVGWLRSDVLNWLGDLRKSSIPSVSRSA